MTGTNDNWNNWALQVIKLWHEKMERMHIWHTGTGFQSFTQHVIANANGDLPRIEFFFIYYLRFVDMGAGRYQRPRKPWYSRTAYAEYMKVNEYLQKRYGEQASMAFIENMKRYLATELKN